MSNGPYLTHLWRKQISDFLFSSVHRDVNFTVTVLLFSWTKRIPWLRPCTPPIAISQSEPAEKNIDRRSLNVRPPERGDCDTDPTETPTIISFLMVFMTNFVTLNICFKKNPTSVCHKTENVPQLCKNNWPDIPLGLFYGVAPWSNLSAVSFLPWHQIWLIEQLKSFRINQMQKTHKRMYEQPQKPHANYLLINGLT